MIGINFSRDTYNIMAKNYFSLYTYYVILLLFYYIMPFVTSLFYI